MVRRKQSRGKCTFCGRDMTKGGLTKHLSTCSQRQEAIGAANEETDRKEVLYHLLVRDAYQSDFWLHLEMTGSATLEDLDTYLRAIWLECCGHMSRFSFGGWAGEDISKGTGADRIFRPGVELTHIYDFGTSSETLIKVVGVREGNPLSRYPIALMARNDPPEVTCMECDQPASWLCIECVYDLGETGMLCDEHVVRHPHDDYGEPVSLVNSPRVGMCGYRGPAEPPY
jgi:hypothetical protein